MTREGLEERVHTGQPLQALDVSGLDTSGIKIDITGLKVDRTKVISKNDPMEFKDAKVAIQRAAAVKIVTGALILELQRFILLGRP